MTKHTNRSTKLLALLFAAALLLSLFPAYTFAESAAQTEYPTPEGYNDYEYQKLLSFLLQEDNLSALGWVPEYPQTWKGVTWAAASGEKRVQDLILTRLADGPAIAGELNLTDFYALQRFSCGENALTKLTVTRCESLTSLVCVNNRLTTLDVRGLTALMALQCQKNNLIALTLGNNPELITLNCQENCLSVLDVAAVPSLKNLSCAQNALTALRVAQNPALETLYCAENSLSTLPLGNCTELTTLECNDNLLWMLDVSASAKLTKLHCTQNELVQLSLPFAGQMQSLQCADNYLGSDTLIPAGLQVTSSVITPQKTLIPASSTALDHQNVTLTALTAADLLYTLDGSKPTATSSRIPAGESNTLTFRKNTTLTVCAASEATLSGRTVSAQYSVKTPAYTLPANQTAVGSQQVTLTPPADTTLYYTTDGSNPTLSSASSAAQKTVILDRSATVKVLAQRTGCLQSDISSAAYTVKTAEPTLPAGGTRVGAFYLTLKAPANTTLYYTTDGTTPTTSSSFISPGGTREIYVQKQMTVSALAVLANSQASGIVRTTYYVKLAKPALSANKTAVGSQTVTITAPAGASLYYSLDGSYPNRNSLRLASGKSTTITVSQNTTVNAIAVLDGCEDSDLASTVYRVKTATPTSSQVPASRTATGSYELKITVPKGTIFYYTTDGKTPTTASKAINTAAQTANGSMGFTLKLSATRTFKIIAISGSREASDVYTATYLVKTATPTIQKGGTGTGSVAVRLAPKGVTWYYTTDGNDPTTKSAKVADGAEKILTLKKNTVLKVIAVASGCESSNTVSSTFKVKTAEPKRPANSTKTGTYTVKLAPPANTTWYYTTNGKKPTTSSDAVIGGYPFNLTVSKNLTLQIIAVQDGCEASAAVSTSFRVRTPAPSLPKSKTAVGSYTVKMKVPANTTWYITTDGKVPTSRMTALKAGSTVNIQITSNTVVRVLAIRTGCDASAVSSQNFYVKAPNAKANLKAGTYKGTQTLKLTASASNTKIYYTTNGSNPTTKSKVYSAPVKITKTTTVKVLVVRAGCKNSDVVTFKYTIK